MEYTLQLDFLRSLLKDMNISSCVLETPHQQIPPQIDLYLRAELFGLDNYANFLQNSMSEAKENTLYRFYDEYDCNYIFLRLPELDSYFFIGPYLLTIPSQERIAQKAENLSLSADQVARMYLYYSSLPLLDDENWLITMANTFAKHLWGSPEQYTLEYIDYAIPDRYAPIPFSLSPGQADPHTFDLTSLENSYANDNKLMEAISKGKLHLVTAAASTVFNNGTNRRLNDSLRDRKNYMIILKTLLRKAAEYGGVHPIHLHRLTSHYAEAIENTRTMKQSFSLQEEMIRDFCQLVKHHSLSKYSYYVGQAITMVQYDLTADLKLKTIAEKLNVNSSYLSTLFHKEVGCTLTDYINKKRIEHSIHLLQLTSKSVQEIATECGIQDVNYFIKLFKKQTGFTPSRYRTQAGK